MQSQSTRVISAIRCQDIQTGLQDLTLAQFDLLLRAGMAARLAIHIRSGDSIRYEHLKEVSFHLFGIPPVAFDSILKYLAEIQFIRIVSVGRRIKSIFPSVPYFEDLYDGIGELAEAEGFNELENISLHILQKLSRSPVNSEQFQQELNVDKKEFDWLIETGLRASYINKVNADSGTILFSPLYFTENAETCLQVFQEHGEKPIAQAMDLLRTNPGLPLEKTVQEQNVSSVPISSEVLAVLRSFVSHGITQPPAITTSYSGTNHFLFVPPVGSEKIPVVEKEIYEKALAIVSSVRQGENFGTYRIRNPIALLSALSHRRELAPTSIARAQYSNLVIRRICRLEDCGNGFESVHLIDNQENVKALNLAIEMLSTTDFVENRGFQTESQNAIFNESQYKESMRSYQSAREVTAVSQDGQDVRIARLLELIQGS